MTIRYYICLLLLMYAGVPLTYSQSIRPDPVPKSFTYSSHTKPLTNENNIETMVLPVPNVDSVVRIEKILDAKGITRPYRFGISIPISFSIHEHGTVDQLENGGRLWRMKFVCPGAQSVNFMLHSYTATQGAFLYTYNSQKSDLEGPWYDKNTRQGKRLGIFPVGGNTAIMEMYLPPEAEKTVELVFESVVYGFRQNDFIDPSQLQKKKIIQGLDCFRDANCSDGDDWCRQKYSIIKILLENSNSLGSGSLINNVLENFTPYILTAFHLADGKGGNGTLDDTEKSKSQDWPYKFRYINEGCENGVHPLPYDIYSGATYRAGWNDTDFLLLELNYTLVSGSSSFPDVHFNGWDKSGDIPNKTICLSHPADYPMKISIDNASPSICAYMSGVDYDCASYHTPPSGSKFWITYLDIGGLSNGVYIIHIARAGHIISKSIIIHH